MYNIKYTYKNVRILIHRKGLIELPTADIITEELVRSLAPNTAAVSNGQKISRSGGFTSLYRSADKTLIFGECKGSGSKPYRTSADFSGEAPVFRCSCPSRQFPCKHSLALMLDWLAEKEFASADIPEDIQQKREKLAKKASAPVEEDSAAAEKKKKAGKAAAAKKLRKQAEGLELAERFVSDILSRGAASVNSSSAAQYKELAKQLGDYYLPEPQAIMLGIIDAAEKLSSEPDDAELSRIVSLCVRLSSAVKKSRAYINAKLESGEVLPEDSVLYEAMGGVWKLTQLKEIGLCRKNARIIQLSFTVLHDSLHRADIDFGYWLDLDTGEVSRTENIRPLKAAKYIKAEDSAFGVHRIAELCCYPGGLNRRIRWELAEISGADAAVFHEIISLAEPSLAEAVKKAKNELKGTLSRGTAAVLVPFDRIGSSPEDGHGVLVHGDETITLRPDENYPLTCEVLQCADIGESRGAVLGELFYIAGERKICLCPISIVTAGGIMRLC